MKDFQFGNETNFNTISKKYDILLQENQKLKAENEELKRFIGNAEKVLVYMQQSKQNQEIVDRLKELDLQDIIDEMVSLPAGDIPTDTYIKIDDLEDKLIKIVEILKGEKK